MRIDPEVPSRLRAEYGSGVRGVASYQRDVIEYHYLRDDIEAATPARSSRRCWRS